jgi:two-component system, cell cycle response regulator DivK
VEVFMAPKTVLVVDDLEEQRDISATLLRHHGYRVLEASGGEEAIRIAHEQQPGVILLDMMMTVLDGWEVADRLRQDPRTADIPIIALTVRHTEEDQERAREAGADSYLVKPCYPADVLSEVQRFIGPAVGLAN